MTGQNVEVTWLRPAHSEAQKNNTKFDESTILEVNYDKVKDIRLVRPTIHRYISGRVKTDFRRIDADEFTVATLLPVQRFAKASVGTVYSDSRKMI